MIKSLLLATLLSLTTASLVHDLTTSDFNAFVASQPVSLIEFYAPWCPVCKDLTALYDSIAHQTNLSLARVDCTVEAPLCQEYQTPIYPTFRVFRDKRNAVYDGPRTEGDILALLGRHHRPLVTKVAAEDISRLRARDGVSIVVHVNDGGEEEVLDVLKSLALEFSTQQDITWAFATIDDDVNPPQLVAYNGPDYPETTYHGPFELDALEDFVWNSITALIREIGTDLPLPFEGPADIPVAYLLAQGPDQRDRLREEFRALAKETREEYLWVVVDPVMYPDFVEELLFDASEERMWPGFGISEGKTGDKFFWGRREGGEEVTAEVIREFLERHRMGELVGRKNGVGYVPSREGGLEKGHEEL